MDDRYTQVTNLKTESGQMMRQQVKDNALYERPNSYMLYLEDIGHLEAQIFPERSTALFANITIFHGERGKGYGKILLRTFLDYCSNNSIENIEFYTVREGGFHLVNNFFGDRIEWSYHKFGGSSDPITAQQAKVFTQVIETEHSEPGQKDPDFGVKGIVHLKENNEN